jgi:hypothetical protein
VLGIVIGGPWLVVFFWRFGKAPQISPVEPKLMPAREEHEAALAEEAELAEQAARADRAHGAVR